MSELRDQAAVLRAIHSSLTSIERHVAGQEANTTQLRESLHDLKNKLAVVVADKEIAENELKKIHDWMGTFDSRLQLVADDITKYFRSKRPDSSVDETIG